MQAKKFAKPCGTVLTTVQLHLYPILQ